MRTQLTVSPIFSNNLVNDLLNLEEVSVSISCWVSTEPLMSNGNVIRRPNTLTCHFSRHLVPEGFRRYMQEWKKVIVGDKGTRC